jgi:hypothetical protein
MEKGLSGIGAAAYFKSRHKDGGCEMRDHHDMRSAMNQKEKAIVKKSEARQASKRGAQIARDPKERAIYANLKSSKKLGGN